MTVLVGLFTNKNFCAMVLLPHPHDAKKRIVHCHPLEYARRASAGHTQGVLQMNDCGECKLVLAHFSVNGVFDRSIERINWNTGDIWQKIQVSQTQVRTMTHRPYIPFSLFLFVWLLTCVKHAFIKCKLHRASSPPKHIPVVYSTRQKIYGVTCHNEAWSNS